MRARALTVGFLNGSLVYEGDEIEVPEKQFSSRWMERIDPPAPAVQEKQARAKVTTVPAAKVTAVTDGEI